MPYAHSKDKAAWDRRYKAANRHKIREISRRHYHNNISAQRKRGREYHADNKDKALERYERRKALKLNSFVENISKALVYQIYGGMCGICKQFINGDFHVDHIKPLVAGGLHCYANVQPAHPHCNLAKGAAWDNKTGC